MYNTSKINKKPPSYIPSRFGILGFGFFFFFFFLRIEPICFLWMMRTTHA